MEGASFTLIAFVALLGWAPLSMMLFAFLPARRAMVVGTIIASVLLPPIAIDLPGLPPYSRYLAASFGVLGGTLIFDMRRILSFRPRWFDLPILLFSFLSPYATAISNDLGPYEGMSFAAQEVSYWLLPYLIGRMYLIDAESFQELAMGLIVSAVCLTPLCLLEARIGANLENWIYGTTVWEGVRDGSYRPRIFFRSGIELGLWFNFAFLSSWWLGRTGRFRSLWGLPSRPLAFLLLIVSFLARARGATLLGFIGWFALWTTARYRTKWVIWVLLAIAPVYYYVRITETWTGEDLVNWIEKNYSLERAVSLEARLLQEKVLIARALKRPVFGWGRYDRMRVVEDEVADVRISKYVVDGTFYLQNVDSMWSVAFGQQGFTGLTMMTLTMILPVVLFLRRFPVGQLDRPALAPITGMAMIESLFLLDGLLNASLNPIYVIIAGGLFNITPARIGFPAIARGGRDDASVAAATGPPIPNGDPAARFQSLGRAAKDRGQLDEAEAAWQRALDLLTELLAAHPEHPALRRRWCDCANDLAWLLAGAAGPAVRDPAGAVALATRTVEMDPECSTYWNTLGAARYRAGDFQAAIADLDRAAALSDGGTPFDHVFLAMAHARSGNPDDARRWFDVAMTELGQDPPGYAELHRLCQEAHAILSAAFAPASRP